MLDTETKSRIDSARDILVGKIPDPKAQVEQITTALIYKFMDDMDKKSVELGGKPQFFTDGFSEFAWTKVMNPRLGGYDRMNLYVEAITKMSQNPHIPTLFRTIFKDAFLPYRDPETLNLFLKEINGFIYDHSERLGDAFEYLLSVLGSQGEAGQFRTPRHIIDFMVEIIAPDKNDTILDPACGTAGFLISAFKHIMNKNKKNKPGDSLNTTERKNLMKNTTGYDISPDMVRISLVNMYLHGFPEPRISEYDTLTSEERWDDMFDVILANPPFMSPKGGIRPHKRFSVQAKRSEVLFVDYIAEHLLPTGRAAVIVPEGIIFQSGTAYKQLRKMLVENSLFGVVSLPAGVFNPYSGVKTSILLMDKTLVKRTDRIIFVKVENDGFDLGAQRRVINKNDLPGGVRNIHKYIECIREGKEFDDEGFENVLVVEKEKIGENGEWNLSGERYKTETKRSSSYEWVPIKDICDINPKKSELNDITDNIEVSFVPMADINENQISFFPKEKRLLKEVIKGYTYFKDRDVLLAKVTPCFENGKAGVASDLINGIGFGSSEFYVIRGRENVLAEWIYNCVTFKEFKDSAIPNMTGTGGLRRIPKSFIESFKIPLPPLEIQKEIVAEIESFQKIIDGARQVVENYKPQIQIDPEWEMVELETVCNVVRGSSPRPKSDPKYYGGNVPRLMVADITRDGMFTTPEIDFLTEEGAKKSRPMKKGDVILTVSGNPGLPTILAIDACIHDGFAGFRNLNKKLIKPNFFYFCLLMQKEKHGLLSVGAVFRNLNTDQIRKFLIPIPELATQNRIVSQIEKEQQLVNANKELITTFEQKIKDRISRIWGEES